MSKLIPQLLLCLNRTIGRECDSAISSSRRSSDEILLKTGMDYYKACAGKILRYATRLPAKIIGMTKYIPTPQTRAPANDKTKLTAKRPATPPRFFQTA